MANPLQPSTQVRHTPLPGVVSAAGPSLAAAVDQTAKNAMPKPTSNPSIIMACVANKGGVGKSTATLQIGYVLSQEFGLRVLLVDGDFQTSLTALIEGENYTSRILEFNEAHEAQFRADQTRINISQVFREPLNDRQFSEDGKEAENVKLTPVQKYENLFYIPGHRTVHKMDHEVELGFSRMGRYRDTPGSVDNLLRLIGCKNRDKISIDIVLIDLSPSASGFNKAVLWGCDYFFTPYFLEPLSINTLQILGDSLLEGASLYRNNPTHDFSDVREKPMAAMACEPKFLGAFPQNVPLRLPPEKKARKRNATASDIRPLREPNAAQSAQLTKARSYLDSLTASLKTHRLVTQFFKPLHDQMVSRMNSVFIDAQDQGMVVIDPKVSIRHPTRNPKGKDKSEPARSKEARDVYLKEFRRLTGSLLLNMNPEHLNFLERNQPRIRELARDYSNIFTTSSGAKASNVASLVDLPDAGVADDYPDEQIRDLAIHYVDESENAATSRVWSHVQIGHHAGRRIAGVITLEGIVAQLRGEITAFTDFTHFYLPVAIGNNVYSDAAGGGHWVLIYGSRLPPSGQVYWYYFDPLGKAIPEILQGALNTVFPGSISNETRSPRVQGSDNNCGPWVVETIRRLVDGEGVPDETIARNININQIRQEQQDLLHSGLQRRSRRKITHIV